jgi:hypothetical protein
MSFTELAVESCLQFVLQVCVVFIFTFTGMQPTFLQVFTIVTSALTIFLGAGKAVTISTVLPNDNPERRVFRRVKNVIWNVIFLCISIGLIIYQSALAIIVALDVFKSFTTLYKIIFIALWSIQLFYLIFMCLFVLKNCLENSQQPWLKCIMLSVYYLYTCISYVITHLVFVPVALSQSKSISLIPVVIMILNFTFVALFFLYASFNVLKLRDVLNLEVMESRHKCPVPNMLFTISLFLIVLDVSGWAFGATYRWRQT